ncbi:MAG: protein kinase/lanthionine synthetase C family protein [Lentilactobacillus buchneri]|nr:protein kinase/lanthionine synthetase C family protein [Lentilactobacillus buchneri]MCI2019700.1 protein kinase/lanthionine synthetase C family protein [Lentilactobacillus buchneri]MCI2028124.1 protein kinase/lanthionine synthetase C family protein [Lentilactobacillus buchneri]
MENYKVKDQEFKELQAYNIKASLHFSNAGGVYLANKNNRKVVLKEGRAHAGLDSHGLGGFERIKKEYYYLNKLQDIDQVVKVYKYFEVWKNNYISEEYIEGNNLMDFLNANYPFIDKTNLYAEKCINIITKLIEIVKLIHSKGIAIGDLQPENIIVLKGGKDLKIIDFESAKSLKDKYAPGISTPGFYSRYSVNYEAADWFALFKITRYLFLPIEAGTELAPDVIANQDAYIKKKFGKRAILTLDRTKVLAAQYTNITPKSPYYNKYLRIPKIPLEVKNIKNNVHAVEKGIIRYMDFKSPSLIKGDIKQFLEPFGVFSVSNGAFGAILALLNSGRLTGDLLNKVEEWIANNKKKIEKLVKQEPLQEGLYTGYTGIAMILAKMGKEQLAENIMLQVNDLDTNDISINSGLAGIGLSTLSYFCLTDNKRYLSLSEKIADHILQIFNNSKIRESLPGGLINGWLGASLFLWKMYMIEKKGDYKKFAIDILNYVIKKRIEIKDGSAFMKDDTIGPNRLAPYLDIGSEGVPLLILEFKNDDASFALSEQMSEVLKYTLATNKTLLTYMDSLFTGFTGLIVLDEALARVDHNYKKQNLNDKLNALNIYLISTDGTDILVPGRYGYKCSMDVETGASGLLMVLNDINTTHCNSWIPLVESKKSHVFDF